MNTPANDQVETPQVETPQTETPQTETPQAEAPQAEAPQAEAPQAETPQAEAPQAEAPQLETLPSEAAQEANTEAPPSEGGGSKPAKDVNVQQPDFSEVPVTASKTGTAMEHLHDVPVEVSAELGRVSMTIGELLRIGEGAVIKLNRQISAPVELVAQGVRVAMADVVVVDDCFAVRIRSVERTR